jgi:hypothetical protein
MTPTPRQVRHQGVGDEPTQSVDGLKEQVRGGRVQRSLLIAELAEQILQRVGQGFDFGQPHHRGSALDGVRCQEHLANRLGVRGVALEAQQLTRNRVELFASFELKLAQELRQVHQSSLPTVWRSSLWSKRPLTM